MFYDGLVVPGALLLLASGTWLIVSYHDGWDFLIEPWLAGMVGLFAFEFIEGNTIGRLYFLCLPRLTRQALAAGRVTPDLVRARKGSGPRSPISWIFPCCWRLSPWAPCDPVAGPSS